MKLRNDKVQDKKVRSFKIKHLKFLSKLFAENGKEKLFPNDSLFISNLKNEKNENYPDNLSLINFCRRTSLHFLTFPVSLLKRNL